MNFNSPSFLVFLPTVVAIYIAVHRRERLRDLFLLGASYYFYMSWDWRYAGLILLSTLVDYAVGLRISQTDAEPKRRLLLAVSVVINLGLLATFKYFNFFVDMTREAVQVIGVELHWRGVELLLPVGISFYTFQSLSYTIDVYRRQLEHERSFIKFALFVSFFPQLVAGPIVRAKEFIPQLHREPRVCRSDFNAGLLLVFKGLFKKIVIADLLAALAVDSVFNEPSQFSSWDLYFALCGYAFQIYNDFSGYSDIAIGVGRMLGFDIPTNFNRPYLAEDVRDFWSRWHITLSTWLRDYLYIPLGGNRRGDRRTYINLMVTMLLGGLWHGAAMNFVIWGAYHGLLLSFAHAMKSSGTFVPGRLLRRAICFHLVLVGWLLFRSSDVNGFSEYVVGLGRFTGGTELSSLYFALLAAAGIFHWLLPSSLVDFTHEKLAGLPAPILGAGFAVLLVLYWGCSLDTPNFIYFQF